MTLGNVADDPNIRDVFSLWRRIPPWHLVSDENRGGVRISSAAFQDDPDGHPMSVVVGEWVTQASRAPESVLTGHPTFGLAAINAGFARTRNLMLVHSPEPDEPAHALVVGNKTGSTQKQFAKKASWVVKPSGRTILAIPRLPADWIAGKGEHQARDLLLPPQE